MHLWRRNVLLKHTKQGDITDVQTCHPDAHQTVSTCWSIQQICI